MTRRIFLDTEWTAPPWSKDCELMWIGLADGDGHVWSAISADVDIDPTTNDFVGGAWKYIEPDEPRMTASEIAAGARAFCGDVDEFWAWIPTLESVAEFFGLGDEAPELYARHWDVDLRLLRGLVDPWPDGWPEVLCDLNRAAVEAGVDIPPRQPNHLNPEVHARWNRDLYEMIRRSWEPST